MFTAHIPSGYILATSILRYMRRTPASSSAVIVAGIVGALAPDIDMASFYLIDHRQTHHHKYITHWPIAWFTLTAISLLWFNSAKQSKVGFLALVFCLGCVLHLILDAFVGDIWWYAPFVDRPYAMFTVPAKFRPWWLSFVLHWSFAVELTICFWALLVYRGRSTISLRARWP